jgi:TonB family protein
MRREFAFALFAILFAAPAAAQQPAPPIPPPAPVAPPTAQTIYYAGPGVTAPALLPVTLADAAKGHCKKLDGTAILSVVVDVGGVSRNVYFLSFARNELDQEALRLVTAERFKPGTHNGSPVAVAISIELDMKACIEEQEDDAGQRVNFLRLRSVPDQKVEVQPPPSLGATLSLSSASPSVHLNGNTAPSYVTRNVSPPVAIYQPEAEYSDKGRVDRVNGPCLVSLIVDVHGMPQNAHIIRSLTPDLDQKALEAVGKYRFKPARLKDGTPVAVRITVEIDFHLYPR